MLLSVHILRFVVVAEKLLDDLILIEEPFINASQVFFKEGQLSITARMQPECLFGLCRNPQRKHHRLDLGIIFFYCTTGKIKGALRLGTARCRVVHQDIVVERVESLDSDVHELTEFNKDSSLVLEGCRYSL